MLIRNCLIVLFFICSSAVVFAQQPDYVADVSNEQLLFVANKGQIINEYGLPADDVLFALTNNGATIFVYRDGLSYQFTKYHTAELQNVNAFLFDLEKDFPLQEQIISTHRIDVKFVNAKTQIEVIPESKSLIVENYFGEQYGNGITNIPTFEKITCKNIYPNIDWVLYSKNGKLKYDLILHPGANKNDITFQITGTDEAHLVDATHMQISSPLGEINDKGLFCFEKESAEKINAAFILSNNYLKFEIDNYNPLDTLIVDPELDWSTFYGGFGEDAVNGIDVDTDGNIYITGYTSSSNAMAHLGYHNSYQGGFFDAYVAKLSPAGNRIWGTYFGGNKGDYGTELVIDKNNKIYVTGFTFSNNFETTPGVHQEALGNNYDAFLFKLNDNGTLIWSTLFGGGSYDYARGIAIDTLGDVYISGSTSSSMAIADGGWQNEKNAGNDEFLAKFSPSGLRIWATYMGGEADDYSRAVGVDLDNNVYLVGYTESTTGIAFSGFDNTWSGNYDCTLTKYNAAGELIWSTYFGGNGDDNANGIDFDSNNNVYIAIQTGTNLGLAHLGYRGSNAGGQDAMLAKFNPDGDRLWSTYYGGTAEDMGKAVAVSGEYVYLCGHTYSHSGIAAYAYQNTIGGNGDALLAKFDVFGNFYWATYAGGYWDEFGRTIHILNDETIIFGGKTFSWDYPVTFGAHQIFYGGGTADGFIQRVYDCASAEVYYTDADDDGYGDAAASDLLCEPTAGFVANSNDCNDANALIYSGATEICNSIDDDCDIIIDEEVITALITPMSPTVFCKGNTVLLQATLHPTYFYQWKKDGVNIVGATAGNYTVTKTGNYTVDISTLGGCNAISNSVAVTVNNKPNPFIFAVGSTDICLTGNAKLKTVPFVGNTYQWYKDGDIITGATSNMYLATAIGGYRVKETNVFGCFKNSNEMIVTNSCKLENDISENNVLQVFPNPASNLVTILMSENLFNSENVQMMLYDNLGQMVWQQNSPINNLNPMVECILPSQLANGMYIVELSVNNQQYRTTLVISR
jgi:hypothetical protein